VDWFEIILGVLVVGFWPGYFFVTKFLKLYRKNELFKHVSWIASNKKRNMSLWVYVHNAQIHCKIHEQYRISTEEEWEFVREILKEFKNDLSRNYFDGVLKIIRSKYVITEEQYFMFTLCSFLKEHQCDREFIGYDMRIDTLDHKSYGNGCYSATYIISDFSIVFHKLLYIAYLECKNSKGINQDGAYYFNEKSIEDVLETKHLKVRVDEINKGNYDELIEQVMQKPITEMKELYNTREIEK
jgi:hypothetical protein